MSRIVLLPLLIVFALSLNLLIPVYSQAYFFSLAVGEAVHKGGGFLEQNIFTGYGLGKTWASSSPAYDLLVFLLERAYGEMGPALLQIILFLLLPSMGFLVALRVSSAGSDSKENFSSRVPVITMWTLIFTGTVLYGVTLDSRLFFLMALFYTVLILYSSSHSSLPARACGAVLLGVMLAFDVRIVLLPFCALGVHYLGRHKNIRSLFYYALFLQLFLLLLTGSISFLRNGFISFIHGLKAEFLLIKMLHPDMFSFRLATEHSALGYSMAFFVLLLLLFAIRLFEEKRPPKVVPAFLLLIALSGSIVSPVLRSVVALGFLCFLSRGYVESEKITKSSKIYKIEETLKKMASGFSKLSYSGRIFLVLAFSFVQLAGFLKYPVTELLMPAREVDTALNEGRCPDDLNLLKSGGYLVYRLQHQSECRPSFSVFTLGSLSDEEIRAIIP